MKHNKQMACIMVAMLALLCLTGCSLIAEGIRIATPTAAIGGPPLVRYDEGEEPDPDPGPGTDPSEGEETTTEPPSVITPSEPDESGNTPDPDPSDTDTPSGGGGGGTGYLPDPTTTHRETTQPETQPPPAEGGDNYTPPPDPGAGEATPTTSSRSSSSSSSSSGSSSSSRSTTSATTSGQDSSLSEDSSLNEQSEVEASSNVASVTLLRTEKEPGGLVAKSFFGVRDHWSPLNLVISLACVGLGLYLAAGIRKENKLKDTLLRAGAAAIGLIALLLMLFTSSAAGPLFLLDFWSIILFGFACSEATLFIYMLRSGSLGMPTPPARKETIVVAAEPEDGTTAPTRRIEKSRVFSGEGRPREKKEETRITWEPKPKPQEAEPQAPAAPPEPEPPTESDWRADFTIDIPLDDEPPPPDTTGPHFPGDSGNLP